MVAPPPFLMGDDDDDDAQCWYFLEVALLLSMGGMYGNCTGTGDDVQSLSGELNTSYTT